jgi:hypothetical protein
MLEDGRNHLSDTLSQLVKLVQPGFHRRLGSIGKEAFLEPFAFLHFSAGQREEGLEQLLCSHLPKSEFPFAINAVSDASGVIYMPGLGYIFTPFPSQLLTVEVERESMRSVCHTPDRAVSCGIRSPVYIPGTLIDVLWHHVPLLSNCFPQAIDPATVNSSARAHTKPLAAALTCLQNHWGALYELLSRVLKRVVIFCDKRLNSFATPIMQGAIFLNAALGAPEVFFLEDLVHQGGHVLLSMSTTDGREFLSVSGSTPVSELVNDRSDIRTLYVVLHGLFTEALIARCLDIMLSTRNWDNAHKSEAVGRLAFILRKASIDQRIVLKKDVLTRRGRSLVNSLLETCSTIALHRRDALVSANLDHQGYNFNLSAYLAENCCD